MSFKQGSTQIKQSSIFKQDKLKKNENYKHMLVYTSVDEYLGHDTELNEVIDSLNINKDGIKNVFIPNKDLINCDNKLNEKNTQFVNNDEINYFFINDTNKFSKINNRNENDNFVKDKSHFINKTRNNIKDFLNLNDTLKDKNCKTIENFEKTLNQKFNNVSLKHYTFNEIKNIDVSQTHLLELPQYCKCIKALQSRLHKLNKTNLLSSLTFTSLLKMIDDSSTSTKYKILDIFLQYKNPPLNIQCLYEKQFLKYLGKFHLLNNIPLSNTMLFNNDLYFDYCFTIDNEDNRRLIDINKIFCKYDTDIVDKMLLLHNLSKSVYLMRTSLINYPVVEYLIIILSAFCNNFDSKNLHINENKKVDCIKNNIYRENIKDIHQYINNSIDKKNILFNFKSFNFIKINENIINININSILDTLSDKRFYEDIEIKSVIIKTLSNLVLDFGNFKKKFVNLNGLHKINKFRDECPLDVLAFYKNFFYTQTHIRLNDEFFKYYFDNHSAKYNLIFKLIRNISNNKINVSSYILDKLVEYFLNVEDLDLIYCMSNILSYNIKFRDFILKNEIFIKLVNLFKNETFHRALVWFIINLSWKEDGSDERVVFINKFHIKEILIDIKDGGLIDKVETAVDQLK